MSKPKIEGGGQTLKTKGNSNYWLYGDDIEEGEDNIELHRKSDSKLLWAGDITKVMGKKAKVKLEYKGKDKSGYGPGDLEYVIVTVTNSDGTSDPYDDTVIVDGPT